MKVLQGRNVPVGDLGPHVAAGIAALAVADEGAFIAAVEGIGSVMCLLGLQLRYGRRSGGTAPGIAPASMSLAGRLSGEPGSEKDG